MTTGWFIFGVVMPVIVAGGGWLMVLAHERYPPKAEGAPGTAGGVARDRRAVEYSRPLGPRALFSAPADHWPLWRPHLLAAFADAGLDVALTDDPVRRVDLRLRDLRPRRPGRATSPPSPGSRPSSASGPGSSASSARCRPASRSAAWSTPASPAAWPSRSPATSCATTSGSTPTSSARTASGATASCRRSRPSAPSASSASARSAGRWRRRSRSSASTSAAGAAAGARSPGIATFAGEDGLDDVLAASDILVTLLPATPETENLLDAARLARLPAGRPARSTPAAAA